MIYPAAAIHVVAVEDDLVVLDLKSDAYFCIPELGAHLSRAETGGWVADNETVMAGLLDTGLFRRDPGQGSTLANLRRPVRTSRAEVRREAGLGAGLRLLAVLATTAARVNGRPLKTLIGRSPDLPVRPEQADDAMAEAQLFDAWMPWVPGQGQCLYRAFLLRAFLAAQGRGSTWVFGVRTWPFSAHCWLQIDDVLLDDDLDRVGLYTPILAVEA